MIRREEIPNIRPSLLWIPMRSRVSVPEKTILTSAEYNNGWKVGSVTKRKEKEEKRIGEEEKRKTYHEYSQNN